MLITIIQILAVVSFFYKYLSKETNNDSAKIFIALLDVKVNFGT